jgi:hypothetical protein
MLDFAWAADKDYSVESFVVPDGPKVFLYIKNPKKLNIGKKQNLTLPNITK